MPAQKVAEDSVSEDERVATARMTKYGAAYTVEVECGDDNDRGCDDDSIAQTYIESLELVGGTKGEPQTKPEMPKQTVADLVAASSLPPGWNPPAGKLIKVNGKWSGKGVTGATIYAPGIRFPVESQPAYLNSQVYLPGGSLGPKSPHGWADDVNYAYPWHDNFCEIRSRRTPRCPGGKGHQGQDIRPAGPPKTGEYYAVATEDGYISKVGSWIVVLMGNSGTRYNYLHLSKRSLAVLAIVAGKKIKRGDRIGVISNEFGGTPTSVHLHFEMMQNLNGQGMVHVPPYTSLVAAYGAM